CGPGAGPVAGSAVAFGPLGFLAKGFFHTLALDVLCRAQPVNDIFGENWPRVAGLAFRPIFLTRIAAFDAPEVSRALSRLAMMGAVRAGPAVPARIDVPGSLERPMHLQLIPLALLLAGPADAADRGPTAYPRAGLLIEARELADPKAAERFRVLDARGKHRYQAGHVPGAVWVDQTTWSREFARGQEPEAWGQRLGRLGIDAETPVVVYDDNSAKDAARVWWILRYWGVRDVRLLNGGWRAWEAGGGMASTEEPAVPAKHPRLEPQSDRLARKEYVLGEVRGKRSQILDARSTGEYCGQEQTARRN